MRYGCNDARRLEVVKALGTLNGIEYLEVSDHDAPSDDLRQRTLLVKLIRSVPALAASNVRISGGGRITHIDVEWVARADALPGGESPALVDSFEPADQFLVVRVAEYGDFSQYTLQLVTSATDDTPPAGFDPRLASVEFSFKVECETDLDCVDDAAGGAPLLPAPDLDYLAKDYGSFRRLMLDRMSLVAPDWRERNAADVGVALVEALAYVADQLSYRQDAIATEAYLGTARSRVSLRRHARLVDYRVHEGSNARAWVALRTESNGVRVPRGTQLLTRTPGLPPRLSAASDPLFTDALMRGAEVFETAADVVLYRDHASLEFYAWGDRECVLPQGARAATLRGRFPRLKVGDVLVFVEQVGPRTGVAADADRTHRWPVRLTHVRASEDPSGGLFDDPPTNDAVPVTEIEWAREDALPFALCISTRTDEDAGGVYLDAVSTAWGNIVLADHGRTLPAAEPLGVVEPSRLRVAAPLGAAAGDRPDPDEVPPRFRPLLRERPLTHALVQEPRLLFAADRVNAITNDLNAGAFSAGLEAWLRAGGVSFKRRPVSVQGGDSAWSVSDGTLAVSIEVSDGRLRVTANLDAAARATEVEPRRASPAIAVRGTYEAVTTDWSPQPDLLSSEGSEPEFVVETEHDGRAFLRFGDDIYGKRPDVGTHFEATYRVGNGVRGNVGAEALTHIVSSDGRLLGATNPLPASGGVEPESAEAIRRDAPEAFRLQERAVTEADYAAVTQRHPSVQRAASTFRWTGSWHTVFLTVDRAGGSGVDADYEQEIRGHVDRYRMAGGDLEVDAPRFVALELSLDVCVLPDYFRAHVQQALQRVFARGWQPDGSRAFFHPDNFTFAQPVYLSDIYAAAQAVPGVESVVVTTFQRLLEPDRQPLNDAVLPMGRLEIVRLDNDPNFPERGLLEIHVRGGK